MADNQAYAFVPDLAPLGVEVRADASGVFFYRCLDAFRESGGLLKVEERKPELSVCLGARPGSSAAASQIVFKPEGKSVFWSSLGRELPPCPASVVAKGHPSIRHAPLDGYLFRGAREISPPPGSVSILASPDGVPLLYKASVAGRSAYVFNMDPQASDFFQSVAFPVSLCSMALDLAKRESSPPVSYAPGQLSPPLREAASLLAPDGALSKLAPGESVAFETPGFYELKGPSSTETFACSMNDPQSSLLDASLVKDSSKPVPKGLPLSDVLLTLAAILLAFESILYHWRKAG